MMTNYEVKINCGKEDEKKINIQVKRMENKIRTEESLVKIIRESYPPGFFSFKEIKINKN
jgi:hypothetical protein